jgi:hypothetical protein
MQRAYAFIPKFEIDKIFEMDETHYLDGIFSRKIAIALEQAVLHKDVRDWSRSTLYLSNGSIEMKN